MVCGHSLEVNVTNKLDFFISTNQIQLVNRLLNQSKEAFKVTAGGISDRKSKSENQGTKSEVSQDSGIDSESVSHNRNASQSPSPKTSVVTMEDDPSVSMGMTPFDILLTANVITCTVYKHILEDLDRSDASNSTKGLKAENSHPKFSGQILPYLHIYFSQPHTVLSCQREGQKFEMSCYDVLVKGAGKGSTTISK